MQQSWCRAVTQANEIKIMECGKCNHSVLGTKDFKASLPVIQFLFYVSWKTKGLYLSYVLPKMQKREGRKKKGFCTGKDLQGSPLKAELFAAGFHLALCMLLGEGYFSSAWNLFACSFLWGMVHACKVVGCSYFISEMCRAETPEFFLEYFKANYVPESLMSAPTGISFECSYLKKSLCNLVQLSKNPWNPKEQFWARSEGRIWERSVLPCLGTGSSFTMALFNSISKEKSEPSGTVTSECTCLFLWMRNLLMSCLRGIV